MKHTQTEIEVKLQNKIESLEEEIGRLNKRLESEKIKLKEERTRFFRLESFVRTHATDQSYIAYLREEMRIIEELNEKNQMTIDNYRKHYQKYGSFYQDWEKKVKDSVKIAEKSTYIE